MQTVSGRIRVRVVPLGGVYTFAPARLVEETQQVRDEAASPRTSRNDGRILRRIEHKRVASGA